MSRGSLSGGFLSRGVSLTETPSPREQNHRCLWKHYLAATSLREVINKVFIFFQKVYWLNLCNFTSCKGKVMFS